jgi:DNA-binding PadR family transcriptional regulator
MTTDFTWTRPRLRVLRALSTADSPLWAVELARTLGMSHGTVYDTFRRLYDVGWAVGITEDNTGKGRPARVMYRLTERGRTEAATLLGET